MYTRFQGPNWTRTNDQRLNKPLLYH